MENHYDFDNAIFEQVATGGLIRTKYINDHLTAFWINEKGEEHKAEYSDDLINAIIDSVFGFNSRYRRYDDSNI